MLSQKAIVKGLPSINQVGVCEGCVYGKQTKRSFPVEGAWRASTPLELIHSDVCGPMNTPSCGESQYFLLFINDYTRMTWVYFLRYKLQPFQFFRKFKAQAEKESGHCIKALCSDRGGEYLSNEFKAYCDDHGIQRQLTAPYTPEQNGVLERKNRTITQMACSLLKGKQLPNQYWAEAVATTIYLVNLSSSKAVLDQTPYEAWKGVKPSIAHLKVFGCIAYALTNSSHLKKLDEKSKKCIFVGYCTEI